MDTMILGFTITINLEIIINFFIVDGSYCYEDVGTLLTLMWYGVVHTKMF